MRALARITAHSTRTVAARLPFCHTPRRALPAGILGPHALATYVHFTCALPRAHLHR